MMCVVNCHLRRKNRSYNDGAIKVIQEPRADGTLGSGHMVKKSTHSFFWSMVIPCGPHSVYIHGYRPSSIVRLHGPRCKPALRGVTIVYAQSTHIEFPKMTTLVSSKTTTYPNFTIHVPSFH